MPRSSECLSNATLASLVTTHSTLPLHRSTVLPESVNPRISFAMADDLPRLCYDSSFSRTPSNTSLRRGLQECRTCPIACPLQMYISKNSIHSNYD